MIAWNVYDKYYCIEKPLPAPAEKNTEDNLEGSPEKFIDVVVDVTVTAIKAEVIEDDDIVEMIPTAAEKGDTSLSVTAVEIWVAMDSEEVKQEEEAMSSEENLDIEILLPTMLTNDEHPFKSTEQAAAHSEGEETVTNDDEDNCLDLLDDESSADVSKFGVGCMRCRRNKDPDKTLLCGWHMYCLNPKLTVIPQGDWFCPRCRPDEYKINATLKRRQKYVKEVATEDEELISDDSTVNR